MVVEDGGRAQLFKNSSRADDSRRNRQDMVSKLRKDKRTEQMLKRRQVTTLAKVQNYLGDIYKDLNPFSLNRFYGVMVSTLDFESKDPSSSLGRTSFMSAFFSFTIQW